MVVTRKQAAGGGGVGTPWMPVAGFPGNVISPDSNLDLLASSASSEALGVSQRAPVSCQDGIHPSGLTAMTTTLPPAKTGATTDRSGQVAADGVDKGIAGGYVLPLSAVTSPLPGTVHLKASGFHPVAAAAGHPVTSGGMPSATSTTSPAVLSATVSVTSSSVPSATVKVTSSSPLSVTESITSSSVTVSVASSSVSSATVNVTSSSASSVTEAITSSSATVGVKAAVLKAGSSGGGGEKVGVDCTFSKKQFNYKIVYQPTSKTLAASNSAVTFRPAGGNNSVSSSPSSSTPTPQRHAQCVLVPADGVPPCRILVPISRTPTTNPTPPACPPVSVPCLMRAPLTPTPVPVLRPAGSLRGSGAVLVQASRTCDGQGAPCLTTSPAVILVSPSTPLVSAAGAHVGSILAWSAASVVPPVSVPLSTSPIHRSSCITTPVIGQSATTSMIGQSVCVTAPVIGQSVTTSVIGQSVTTPLPLIGQSVSTPLPVIGQSVCRASGQVLGHSVSHALYQLAHTAKADLMGHSHTSPPIAIKGDLLGLTALDTHKADPGASPAFADTSPAPNPVLAPPPHSVKTVVGRLAVSTQLAAPCDSVPVERCAVVTERSLQPSLLPLMPQPHISTPHPQSHNKPLVVSVSVGEGEGRGGVGGHEGDGRERAGQGGESEAVTWDRKCTLKLIQLYKEHRVYLTDHHYKKKSVWELIASKLRKSVTDSPPFRWNHVENKWKNMTKKFRDCRRNAMATKCSYFDEISAIYNFNPEEERRKAAEGLRALKLVPTHAPGTATITSPNPGLLPSKGNDSTASLSSKGETTCVIGNKPRGQTEGETESVPLVKKKKYAHLDTHSTQVADRPPAPSLSHPPPTEEQSGGGGRREGEGEGVDIVGLLTQLREERARQDRARMDRLERMHQEKMAMFARFLDILQQNKSS